MITTTKNKDINIFGLNYIANLKHKAWPAYSVPQHLAWMVENLKDEDIHLLYYVDNVLQAYMNVFKIEVLIDGVKKEISGTGNLCSNSSNGYGFLLMKNTIQKGQWMGFCKAHLIEYYKYMGWVFPEKSKLIMPNVDLENYHCMVYGFDFTILKYTGNKF
jgi:hypothetical protein